MSIFYEIEFAKYILPYLFFALAAGRNGNGNLQATPERIWDPLFFDFNQTNL
jgi:hypothetical protein